MATYATAAQLRAYSDLTGGSDADLERVLVRAQGDVDSIAGYHGALVAGLKFVPANLTSDQRTALQNATCAQAEYRITMGEDFMVRAQYEETTGRDFGTKGRLPRIGPKTKQELLSAPGMLDAWGAPV
jgi:hypothetical protein